MAHMNIPKSYLDFTAILVVCISLTACETVFTGAEFETPKGTHASNVSAHGSVGSKADLSTASDAEPRQSLGSRFKRFFSRENQREISTRRSQYAALATYGDPGRGRAVDTGRINRGPQDNERIEFVGSLSDANDVQIAGYDDAQNLREMKEAGAKPFGVNERVEIRFNDDSLSFVVKQLLGGLLEVNFIANSDLVENVSFQTEQPVLKSRVPSITRDILARYGYVMKLINGVYQIGTAEVIQQLETNSAIGESGEITSRVITLERGNAEELANVIASVLPLGASVTPVASSNAIVLRANHVDIGPAEDLLRALVSSGAADELIAIIPLKQSPPEQVAASLLSFYQANATPASKTPIIIPLENQQSLLVGAKSRRGLENARLLIRGLDKDLRDQPSLRVITLMHLKAEGISSQLNAIFGESAANEGSETQKQQDEDPDIEGAGASGDGVVAPAIIRRSSNDRGQGSPNASRFQQRVANTDFLANAGPITVQPGTGISIVPDNRNNTLLVFSTFKQFKRIREVVRALDLPLAQVVIEATIVEVEINDELGYGVQWFLSGRGFSVRSSQAASPADPGGAGGVGVLGFNSLGSLNASVVLSALQAVTNVQIISSPYLTVLNGSAARLSIGDQVPFITARTTSDGNGDVTVTNQVEVRDTGIILEVTPHVSADNSVTLNISQEVSSVLPGAASKSLTPTIAQRSINSEIVVHSGKTVLLGGLIQDNTRTITTGVPVLKKIPVLGNLFKQKQDDISRTELLVMITPRVIRKASQLEHITRQLQSGLTVR